MSEEPQYYLVVVDKHDRIRSKRGPMSKEQAELARPLLKQKVAKKYRVQVRKDRKAYFATYHANRYKNDPAYKARLIKNATDWNRKAKAAARGDLTPWLE